MADQITRRQFVQKLSYTTAAATLSLSGLSSFASVPKKKLGIALVGLGNYATNKLAPALQETQNCYLAGIVTGTPAKAEKWKKQYNIPEKNIYNYETYDQIADNDDIDAVYIVLPNGMHAEYTIRGAQAGKHVICEKPMANTVKEGQEMIDACKAAGKQLAIGYRLHFEPFNLEAMRYAREEVFGPVKFIEGSFGFKAGDPKQWRLNKALSGGGPLMDVGIYVIQASRYVSGMEPIAVTAQEFKTDPIKFNSVEETITWTLEFPDNLVATGLSSYASNTERLRVACANGWYEMSPAYSYGPIKGRTSKGTMDFPHTNHQALHMDAVSQQILDGVPNTVPGEEGLKDMKVIEAIYKAAKTGKRVKIK